MKFLIARNGQQYGPYPSESLPGMLRKGEVVPTDMMFVEGWPTWKSVADYLKTQAPPVAVVTAVPPPLPRQQPPPIPAGGQMAAATPPLLESGSELESSVLAGGRFVVFQYCFSVLIMTFRRSSSVIFLRGDEDGFGHAFQNSLISLTAGWWGFPWGPIWTIGTVIKNARGGTDVTQAVLTDKLGPTRAVQIMSRRQMPAPRGNAMKYFRWGLVGAPALLVLLLMLLPYALVSTDQPDSRRPARGEAPAFMAANRQINVHHDAVAFGNSPEAIAAAESFSKTMKTMREVLFEAGKKGRLSVSDHQFLTYCQLQESRCAFIVHVPELRRFSVEAKKSLGELAWVAAQGALKELGTNQPGRKLAVGLRGVVLYDRVLLGEVPANNEGAANGPVETVTSDRPERRLYSFFQKPDEVSPAGSEPPPATPEPPQP